MSRGRHLAPKTLTGRATWLTVGLMLGLFLAMSIPAGANSWEEKATGSATYDAFPGLKVGVSAWTDSDGGFGNAQYEYYSGDTLLAKFHFQAEEVCFHMVGDDPGIKMWGYWKMQEGTAPYSEPIAGVAITDVADGADTLRVPLFVDEAEASSWCNGAGGWGGPILTGDYRIRQR